MKKILVNVPEKQVEFLDKLKDLGMYSNRNEMIRMAIKDFIAKESIFLSNFNSDTIKLNDIHKRFVEFNEELKSNLFPAYSPIEKEVI